MKEIKFCKRCCEEELYAIYRIKRCSLLIAWWGLCRECDKTIRDSHVRLGYIRIVVK